MFPQIFGKYVLEREIAAGGMARVYLATLRGAVGFEKRLVVKQIRAELASDEAFVSRFVDEAKTAVELSHPNIVPVYELGVELGVYYIAMELCEGLTLSEVLSETGPLGPAEGAYVGAEICRALDYAHRRANIVHRDVTPRNVLIDDEGEVRLIDFGIAAPVNRAEAGTRTEIFGSPGHMPPEQLHGADLTPATDVFAVGVLLIEAWTGSAPFRRATARESEQALFHTPPSIARQIPALEPLAALIAETVALSARARPSAAELLARPLREFLKTEDSGDIKRRLGARVQRCRGRLRPSRPPSLAETERGPDAVREIMTPNTEPASEHQSAAPVTRTFAAHGDLEVWTRKLSSAPAPSARAAGGSNASSSPGVRDPKVGDGSRSHFAFPLATASAISILVVAFVFGPRASAVRALARSPISKPQIAIEARGSSGRLETPPLASASLPVTSRVERAKFAPKAREAPATRSPSPAASGSVGQSGALRITADPQAVVEITGPNFHESHQTPIFELNLSTGRYRIVFRNQTLNTPLGAEVVVVSGTTRSVHADFRQAEPLVTVH